MVYYCYTENISATFANRIHVVGYHWSQVNYVATFTEENEKPVVRSRAELKLGTHAQIIKMGYGTNVKTHFPCVICYTELTYFIYIG